MNERKTLQKILAGSRNTRFADVTALVEAFGFHSSRTHGSHHIFARPDVPELVNLQEVKGQAISNQAVLEARGTSPLGVGGAAMKDYHINIFYSEEDDGYIANIPDLEACSAFGETAAEALAEVERAKAAWLEAAHAEGKPIPPPRYRPVIYQATS